MIKRRQLKKKQKNPLIWLKKRMQMSNSKQDGSVGNAVGFIKWQTCAANAIRVWQTIQAISTQSYSRWKLENQRNLWSNLLKRQVVKRNKVENRWQHVHGLMMVDTIVKRLGKQPPRCQIRDKDRILWVCQKRHPGSSQKGTWSSQVQTTAHNWLT